MGSQEQVLLAMPITIPAQPMSSWSSRETDISVPTGETPAQGERVANGWRPQDLSVVLLATCWALPSFVTTVAFPPAPPSQRSSLQRDLCPFHPLAAQWESDLKKDRFLLRELFCDHPWGIVIMKEDLRDQCLWLRMAS